MNVLRKLLRFLGRKPNFLPQEFSGGTILCGLIKTYTEEPRVRGHIKCITQWYDSESSPPRKIGHPLVAYRLDR